MVDFSKKLKELRDRKQQEEFAFRDSFETHKPPPTKRWKLWEPCTDLSCHINDQRFTTTEKHHVKGYQLPQFRIVKKDPSEITATEKEFWTRNDKCWAWHCYLMGSTPEMICEFVGGRKEELIEWVKSVCRGEEICIYNGSFPISQPWTARQDRMLWLMYESRILFYDAARLLGRFPTSVKERLIHLKREKP